MKKKPPALVVVRPRLRRSVTSCSMPCRVTTWGRGSHAPSRISVSSGVRRRAGSGMRVTLFFGEAVVGKHLGDKAGTDVYPQRAYGVGDLIHIVIRLKTLADDECLHLLGALWRWVGAGSFGEEVGRRPVEDRVADVVGGFARLEAKGLGELTLGEGAEFSEDDHADLLLHVVFLGERDGFAVRSRQHEGAILDLHVDGERDLHGHPLPHGGIDKARELCR